MSTHITVDPITRIEGHLRIDVEVDGGVVKKAWSSGQMFRGIERILEGRDPREAWVFTQRFCGVCTTVHALASVRAVDQAVQSLGGNGLTKEYGIAAAVTASRLGRIAPVSREMVLNFVAQTSLGLPRSY